MASADYERERHDIIRGLRAASRIVETDVEFGIERWDTPDGHYWVPSGSDSTQFFGMLAEQRQDVYGSGARGVRPGDVVLDAGGNIGIFSRKALAMGASHIVAVEPSPINLECFRRNLSDEIAGGLVTLLEIGVWNEEDTLRLVTNKARPWGDSFVRNRLGSQDFVDVPVRPLDAIVDELALRRLDFIKMDIEGSERYALAGAKRTIAEQKPRMAICVYHSDDDFVEVPRAVEEITAQYETELSACRNQIFSAMPEILYFYPEDEQAAAH